MLHRLADAGLVKGQTVGIDATTLEANAALRSIVRRDTGESYQDFLTNLAHASGIKTPHERIWRGLIGSLRELATSHGRPLRQVSSLKRRSVARLGFVHIGAAELVFTTGC